MVNMRDITTDAEGLVTYLGTNEELVLQMTDRDLKKYGEALGVAYPDDLIWVRNILLLKTRMNILDSYKDREATVLEDLVNIATGRFDENINVEEELEERLKSLETYVDHREKHEGSIKTLLKGFTLQQLRITNDPSLLTERSSNFIADFGHQPGIGNQFESYIRGLRGFDDGALLGNSFVSEWTPNHELSLSGPSNWSDTQFEVAILYYFEPTGRKQSLSQSQIATLTGVSQSTVSRHLQDTIESLMLEYFIAEEMERTGTEITARKLQPKDRADKDNLLCKGNHCNYELNINIDGHKILNYHLEYKHVPYQYDGFMTDNGIGDIQQHIINDSNDQYVMGHLSMLSHSQSEYKYTGSYDEPFCLREDNCPTFGVGSWEDYTASENLDLLISKERSNEN